MFRRFGTVPFISVKILALSATLSTFIDQLLMAGDKPHKIKDLKLLIDKQKYTMYIICTEATQLQEIAADVVIIKKF